MRASSNRVEGLSFCDVEHLHDLSTAIRYHTQQLQAYSIKVLIMSTAIHYYYHFHWVEGLCCLILPGLRRFGFKYDHRPTFLNLKIMGSDIRPHITRSVSLVIAWFFSSLQLSESTCLQSTSLCFRYLKCSSD